MGVVGELMITWHALPYIKQRRLHSLRLPNAVNLGFDYHLFCQVRFVVHMMQMPRACCALYTLHDMANGKQTQASLAACMCACRPHALYLAIGCNTIVAASKSSYLTSAQMCHAILCITCFAGSSCMTCMHTFRPVNVVFYLTRWLANPLAVQVGVFGLIPVAFMGLYTYMLQQRTAKLSAGRQTNKQRQE